MRNKKITGKKTLQHYSITFFLQLYHKIYLIPRNSFRTCLLHTFLTVINAYRFYGMSYLC